LFTTIHVSTDPFALNVLDAITGCPSGVDLTAPPITAGSSPGLVFTYFTDPNEINYLPTPKEVTSNGTYYIRGVNSAGCNDIKPIRVEILPPPNIFITDPEGVCSPQKIDITKASVTAGSDAGLTFTYWKDAKATIPLNNPGAVDTAGTYYIKGIGSTGCSTIRPVNVKIGAIPIVLIHNPTGCGSVDLTNASITTGSTTGITYTYWADAAATISLTNANAITLSGLYYIKATHVSGCSIIKPVTVTINPVPVFTVRNPSPVKFPVTIVDITTSVSPDNSLVFSYWLDSTTRKRVANPEAVDKRGTYYVKGTNIYGCSMVKPINVVIIPSTDPVIYAPNAFTPNNDGLNDMFKIKALGELTIHHFKIYNRWGQVIFNTADISNSWNGKFTGNDQPMGTYIWYLDGYDEYYKKNFTKNGAVTLVR
jgi:gliding motility-associated-like protein